MSYTAKVLEQAINKNPNEQEYHQALAGILPTLQPVINQYPEYEKAGILERLVEPERQIIFRIAWVDDKGAVHVNRGYQVQFNSAMGPYKGGLRFHPSVSLSIVKFLGIEQVFSNSLSGLPIGGGKGGADFNPKGKSDSEIMAFCQSFVTELYRHMGEDFDIPTGDIGVGQREIGYLYGQYKKLACFSENTFAGSKTPDSALLWAKAVGWGLVYMAENMLLGKGTAIKGKTVAISGSGNVALYAAEKAEQLGAKVVTISDSKGYIYDEDSINIEVVKKIKEKRESCISKYLEYKKTAKYFENGLVWSVPCDVALPCATQNELPAEGAEMLIKNGCIAVAEGSAMAASLEAVRLLQNNNILFAPSKAASAGGPAVSALVMAQTGSWEPPSVDIDGELKTIIHNVYAHISAAAENYGMKGNLPAGANIAAFKRIATAMLRQGV